MCDWTLESLGYIQTEKNCKNISRKEYGEKDRLWSCYETKVFAISKRYFFWFFFNNLADKQKKTDPYTQPINSCDTKNMLSEVKKKRKKCFLFVDKPKTQAQIAKVKK